MKCECCKEDGNCDLVGYSWLCETCRSDMPETISVLIGERDSAETDIRNLKGFIKPLLDCNDIDYMKSCLKRYLFWLDLPPAEKLREVYETITEEQMAQEGKQDWTHDELLKDEACTDNAAYWGVHDGRMV